MHLPCRHTTLLTDDMTRNNQPTTFSDRLAMAFFSAVVGGITAVLFWMVLSYLFLSAISVQFIVGFTLLCALLGFLTMENWLLKGFEKLWRLLLNLMRF
jgi:predicted lipid-binding transport protein (Tim44 family)